ncbi:glycosyltransferase family 2 protein [Photobacterium damselae]|uniref:glycosyltransferase family 2 protein n=1 Tax=Photobacterium damselae TaxID=38293 RepID=UPI00370AA3B6
MKNNKLGIVIVFYNPELEHINNAISLSEKYDLVVVDNSVENYEYNIPLAEVIRLGDNLGIATALNNGINFLINNGYRYSLLLDQDSAPSLEVINRLFDKAHLLMNSGNVAAVSPAYFDKAINKRCSFIKIENNSISRVESTGNEPFEVSYTITSGSILDLSLISKIGLMQDDLFIDFVDIEWCFRATSFGYKIFAVPSVVLEHEIGCEPINIFGRVFVNHSPIRHYYYFRNAILLIRRNDIPKPWKKFELIKIIPRFFVYALFTTNRLEHINMMISGLYDGILARKGKKR